MDGTGAAWRSLAVPSAIAFDTSMRHPAKQDNDLVDVDPRLPKIQECY